MVCRPYSTHGQQSVLFPAHNDFSRPAEYFRVRHSASIGRRILGRRSALNLYLGNNPAHKDGGIDWAGDVEPHVASRKLALPNEAERQRAFGKETRPEQQVTRRYIEIRRC